MQKLLSNRNVTPVKSSLETIVDISKNEIKEELNKLKNNVQEAVVQEAVVQEVVVQEAVVQEAVVQEAVVQENNVQEKIDLLEEIENFNIEDTKKMIESLRSKLSDETKANVLLTKENSQKKIDDIEKFVENYSDEVSKQLIELQTVVPKLKEIIESNKELKNQKNELEALENRKDVKTMSRELQCIKKLQMKIKNYLEKNES